MLTKFLTQFGNSNYVKLNLTLVRLKALEFAELKLTLAGLGYPREGEEACVLPYVDALVQRGSLSKT